MRRAFLQISANTLTEVLTGLSAEMFRVRCSLPVDAKFIKTVYDEKTDSWLMLFEHDSFKDIQSGRQYPIIKSPVFELMGPEHEA